MATPRRVRTVHEHGFIIDPATGEAQEAIFQRDAVEESARGGKRRRRVSMAFTMVDQHSARDLELSGVEARCLNVLLSTANPKDAGRSAITVTRIAQHMDIAVSGASRALTALRARNIVFKEGPSLWRVTPWYAWVGAWADWDKTAREYPEPKWKRS